MDTLGLPLAVLVQLAGVQDPVGAAPVLAEAKARAPGLQLLWADARYQGPLVATAATALGLRVEVVGKPPMVSHPAPTASWCCLGAGRWNAPSAGSANTAAWRVATTKPTRVRVRPLSKLVTVI